MPHCGAAAGPGEAWIGVGKRDLCTGDNSDDRTQHRLLCKATVPSVVQHLLCNSAALGGGSCTADTYKGKRPWEGAENAFLCFLLIRSGHAVKPLTAGPRAELTGRLTRSINEHGFKVWSQLMAKKIILINQLLTSCSSSRVTKAH